MSTRSQVPLSRGPSTATSLGGESVQAELHYLRQRASDKDTLIQTLRDQLMESMALCKDFEDDLASAVECMAACEEQRERDVEALRQELEEARTGPSSADPKTPERKEHSPREEAADASAVKQQQEKSTVLLQRSKTARRRHANSVLAATPNTPYSMVNPADDSVDQLHAEDDDDERSSPSPNRGGRTSAPNSPEAAPPTQQTVANEEEKPKNESGMRYADPMAVRNFLATLEDVSEEERVSPMSPDWVRLPTGVEQLKLKCTVLELRLKEANAMLAKSRRASVRSPARRTSSRHNIRRNTTGGVASFDDLGSLSVSSGAGSSIPQSPMLATDKATAGSQNQPSRARLAKALRDTLLRDAERSVTEIKVIKSGIKAIEQKLRRGTVNSLNAAAQIDPISVKAEQLQGRIEQMQLSGHSLLSEFCSQEELLYAGVTSARRTNISSA